MKLQDNRETSLTINDMQPTQLQENLDELMRVAQHPVKVRRYYRVYAHGRPLWLSQNRNIFNSRVGAKTALRRWAAESLSAVCGHRRSTLLTALGLTHDASNLWTILDARIEEMIQAGTVEIREMNLETDTIVIT